MQNCTAVDEALTQRLGLEQPAFVAQLLPQLMDLVRASRRLPVGEEHAIRRGSKEFLSASKELGQRSMSAVQRTMRWLDPELASGGGDLVSFNLVEDSIDNVLERVDSCLRDALAGLSRASEAEAEPELIDGGAAIGGGSSMGKPQVRWRELIDNDRTEFVPRLLVKHNQKVPLPAGFLEAQRRAGFRAAEAGQQADAGSGANKALGSGAGVDVENTALKKHLGALGVERNQATPALCNPYEEELRLISYSDGLFETQKPQMYGRMEDTPLVWVRTARELRQMINEVQATCVGKEIAVDVEHHDLRSYRGFTCLVQLSTRQKDFLIDPFDIFEQMHWLNEITSDPAILKVLHGSDRDVMWLQRDFSVFLVNMFDTGQATRTLQLQGGFSLANLVSHFCGVKLDKKYQTCDWRQRPISTEMAHYARCDTHYLLYCFDALRNALLANGPCKVGDVPTATAEGILAMRGVLDRTAALCMKQYTESPFGSADAAMRLCERFGSKQKPLESRQFAALKALCAWRDTLGRRLDESTNFIAPDACLWRVALALPTTAARLRSTCNPLPQLLQQHASEVVDVVVNSADAAANADVARSPCLAPARSLGPAVVLGVLGSQQEKNTLASPGAAPMLPPATSPAAKPRSVAERQEAWPPTSCRESSPIVRISSGSLRHVSNGGGLKRQSSLHSMFESESSADEEMDVDIDALKNLAPAFARVSAAPVISWPLQTPASIIASMEARSSRVMEKTAAQMKEEAEVDAAVASAQAQPPQSLRDTYQLPSTTRRKKKKKVPTGNLASAATGPATGAESMEAEAASFRTALAAAFETAPATGEQPPTRLAKKRTYDQVEAPVLADPYAASAPVDADPYSALGDPYAQAAVPAAPDAPVMRKKKKLKKRIAQPPIADPYL